MIEYFNEDIDFPDISKSIFSKWIKRICDYHKVKLGDISYVFCSDEYILKINQEYLEHNYETDIITFNYNEEDGQIISGDMFISLDTVHSNAEYYKVDFLHELKRVMIHGILHLIGFNDSTQLEQDRMTVEENKALDLFSS